MMSRDMIGALQAKLQHTLALPDLNILAPIALIISPIVAFFNVQAFGVLMLLLALDFLTGLYKAKLLKKVCSTRFGDMFDRTFAYTVIFISLHAFVLVFPMAQYIEVMVIGGYISKELLSILENLHAIEVARGKNFLKLDKLIDKLGLDLEKILDGQAQPEVKEVKTDDRTES